MPWGDYEWYSNQQASYTELPDEYGYEQWEEYVEEYEPEDEDDTPKTYDDWVSDNYDDLLYQYEQEKEEARAEAILDAREDYYR